MKRFNKFFAKKERSDEHSTPIDFSSLSSMPTSDLVSLIYKYDEELKRLNPLLATATEDRDKAQSDAQRRAEESKLYKNLAEVMYNPVCAGATNCSFGGGGGCEGSPAE